MISRIPVVGAAVRASLLQLTAAPVTAGSFIEGRPGVAVASSTAPHSADSFIERKPGVSSLTAFLANSSTREEIGSYYMPRLTGEINVNIDKEM